MRLKVSLLLFCFQANSLPIQDKLDVFFSDETILENIESVKEAGFLTPKRNKWSQAIVSKHPNFKGYLFKMYTDDQEEISELERFNCRIEGAQKIRKAIYSHGFQDRFAVAKKWIYPLPIQKERGKKYILVVQDMHLVDRNQNLSLWNKTITKEDLTALYLLLGGLGLADSVYPFNLAFNKRGKLIFVDTEVYEKWPVPFEKLLPYLSPENQQFWPPEAI